MIGGDWDNIVVISFIYWVIIKNDFCLMGWCVFIKKDFDGIMFIGEKYGDLIFINGYSGMVWKEIFQNDLEIGVKIVYVCKWVNVNMGMYGIIYVIKYQGIL